MSYMVVFSVDQGTIYPCSTVPIISMLDASTTKLKIVHGTHMVAH
jgi:hypothetical protein